MSYSTLMAIWPGDRIEKLEELRNSWGTAPVVWRAFARRFLGREASWMTDDKSLWRTIERRDMTRPLKLIFAFTFDRTYCPNGSFGELAEAIDAFLVGFPPSPGTVNHWPHIAEVLRSATVPAIGLNATSVVGNLFAGAWNEEKDEPGPIPWDRIRSILDVVNDASIDAEAI